MKNTNIDWIGNIPDNWKVKRVKNCFYLSKEKAHLKDPVVLRLARNGVHVKDVTINEGQMAESYEDYNPVCVGDLLLNPMDLYSGANCNVSEVEGVISPAYQNLRKKIELNPKYFDYYFKTQYWTMAMFAHGKGISFDNRWTINSETILNYYLPFPSLDEQNKIVLALNNKLSQVDELIANQQVQIEKLKEYKQSVITEAVTKGLDKNAPMKESGIEWIGEIPESWGIVLLSSLFVEHKHKNIGMQSNNLLSLSYGKIKRKDIYGNEGLLPESFEGYNVIGLGDIVLRLTDLQNDQRSLRTGLCEEEGIVTSAYVTLRERNENLNSKYMHYYLHAFDINKGFYAMGSGVRQGLNYEGIRKLQILFPSIEEQGTIVEFLEDKCGKIDQLIAIKQEKIEKLQEYKKSLIYEYVTGKKEVV